MELSCRQAELGASPATLRVSVFTATLLPDGAGACLSFPSTTHSLVCSKPLGSGTLNLGVGMSV